MEDDRTGNLRTGTLLLLWLKKLKQGFPKSNNPQSFIRKHMISNKRNRIAETK